MLISGEKVLMSAEFKRYLTWFLCILDLLWVRYNCAKFHHCRICVTEFKDGNVLCTHPWAAPKKLILNRVNVNISNYETLCRDINKHIGGLLFYINKNIPCKAIKGEDIPNDNDMILFEFLVKTRKWLYAGIYKAPFLIFFKGIKQTNMAIWKYYAYRRF